MRKTWLIKKRRKKIKLIKERRLIKEMRLVKERKLIKKNKLIQKPTNLCTYKRRKKKKKKTHINSNKIHFLMEDKG